MRIIVLDLETTGLRDDEGHRITEIGLIEMIDGVPTGKTYHSHFNPGRPVPEFITNLTGLTDEFLADKPDFASKAKDIRKFIGDTPVLITCRTVEGYTLDIAFLNAALKRAGFGEVPEKQWINVRRWGEAMFGHDQASLDKMLDRYEIDRTERDENGHGALLDAGLLAKLYPQLYKDYVAHIRKSTPKRGGPKR